MQSTNGSIPHIFALHFLVPLFLQQDILLREADGLEDGLSGEHQYFDVLSKACLASPHPLSDLW
jgi:hypothetical protein